MAKLGCRSNKDGFMRKRWRALARLTAWLLFAAPLPAALAADPPRVIASDRVPADWTDETMAGAGNGMHSHGRSGESPPERFAPSAQYEQGLREPWPSDRPQNPGAASRRGMQTPILSTATQANAQGTCPNCGYSHHPMDGGTGLPELEPLFGPDPGEWLFRPLSGGWFMGIMWGDELIRSRVDQHQGFFGGVRLGWDWHENWGWETRLGFAAVDLSGVPPDVGQDADWFLWDVSMLYYPWADERWRPYMSTGMGVADISFNNDLGGTVDETLFAVVIGLGIKYRLGPRVVTRLEFLDNIAFGTRRDLTTANNLSLTFGLEYRWGGSRTRYWPWEPAHRVW